MEESDLCTAAAAGRGGSRSAAAGGVHAVYDVSTPGDHWDHRSRGVGRKSFGPPDARRGWYRAKIRFGVSALATLSVTNQVRQPLILPTATTIERLCADALVDAERRIEARIAERVPSRLRRELLELNEESRVSLPDGSAGVVRQSRERP